MLYFGGTAYLGLQSDPEYQDILIENIRHYGTSYGASRLSNVRFSVFEDAEALLSLWIGCEASATLSSGYLACQLLCQSLEESGHQLFPFPNAHRAIRPTRTPNKQIESIRDLKTAVENSLLHSGSPVVLLDSVDFHGKHYPDFEELKKLPLDQLSVVVDDSHGFGVLGSKGQGASNILRELGAKELIICGSLNKGLALQAGVVSGTRKRIDQFCASAAYAGTSPTAPANMATFLAAQSLYKSRHASLKRNIATFLSKVYRCELFEYNRGHTVFSLKDPILSHHLERNNILITRFTYPSQGKASLNRIVISAAHREEDIQDLSRVVSSYSQATSD